MDGAVQRKGQNNQIVQGFLTFILEDERQIQFVLFMNESVLDQIDFQREGFDAALTLELLFFLQCWFPQMAFHVLVQHAEHRKFFLAVFTLKRFVSWMNRFKMILKVVWLRKKLFTLWAWEQRT